MIVFMPALVALALFVFWYDHSARQPRRSSVPAEAAHTTLRLLTYSRTAPLRTREMYFDALDHEFPEQGESHRLWARAHDPVQAPAMLLDGTPQRAQSGTSVAVDTDTSTATEVHLRRVRVVLR